MSSKIFYMKTTITDFKKKIKRYFRELEKNQDILVLSRAKSTSFVVLTLDQYNAMEETIYLLSTPTNAAHLI